MNICNKTTGSLRLLLGCFFLFLCFLDFSFPLLLSFLFFYFLSLSSFLFALASSSSFFFLINNEKKSVLVRTLQQLIFCLWLLQVLLVDLKILATNFHFMISLLTGIVQELGHLKVKYHQILEHQTDVNFQIIIIPIYMYS